MSQPHKLPSRDRQASDTITLVLTHLVAWATIVGHIIIVEHRSLLERQGAVAAGVIVLMLLILRATDARNGNRYLKLFMGMYLVSSGIALIFLSDLANTYVIVWLMVAIFGYLHFEKKGVWLTVACFSTATIIKYFYISVDHRVSLRETMFMVVNFFVVVALCQLYILVQSGFDNEHDRLKLTTHEAIVEQKRLKALINNMTESVLVLDTSGVIKLYNAAALALFDTNTNLDGKLPEEVINLEDEKGGKIPLLKLLPTDTKPVTRNDVVLRYSEEDKAALSITITPLRASFGNKDEDNGFVITMRDITREKSLEEERNEFISVISHELRTPVTVTEASISNAMLINERGGESDKVLTSLRLAHDQSIYLANMLNDLSTFARAERGTLELNLEPIDPRELIERLENDYHNEVEVKGMHIISRAKDNTPKSIVSNRLYIREILQNFVTNAIKYSDTGTITISCEEHEAGIKFSITDEGIGISTSDQKKVFDKFFRAEDFRTRSSNGTGLGLYIVKKLAKLLQASFELESELGKGSTFSLIVPDLSGKQELHHMVPADVDEEMKGELGAPGAPAGVPSGEDR